MTIDVDVDPVVLLAGPDSDTERVPDCRQPYRVEVVVGAREIQFSKYFASDPLETVQLLFVILSAALVVMITGLANIATQQGIPPIRNDGLEWRIILVS